MIFWKKKGINNFFNLVSEIDREALEKIDANDVNRLKRVWEVFKYTNITISDWKKNNTKKFLSDPDYFLYLFLPDRKKNYERVNKRFLNMINKGAINEVKELLSLKLDESLPIMRAHGVPEINLYLKNKINLDECIEKSQQITRNYVKRQHTWWNSTSLRIHQKLAEFPDQIGIKLMNFD